MLAGGDIYKTGISIWPRSLAIPIGWRGTGSGKFSQQSPVSENIARTVKTEEVDLTQLVEQQVQQARELAQMREQALHIATAPGVLDKGDPVLLQRAMAICCQRASLFAGRETIHVSSPETDSRN